MQTSRQSVLLVDDDESVRAVGRKMLERIGFTVVTAADGSEAIARFRERADDIICAIVDLTMPHVDGAETFRELRRMRPGVRVILSSGYNEQDVTQRFVGKGLAGFIQKPYQLSTLVAVLKEVLEHHIEEEEREFFPKVQEALGSDSLELLGEELEDAFEDALSEDYHVPLFENLRQVLVGTLKPSPRDEDETEAAEQKPARRRAKGRSPSGTRKSA